ncbi:hypothetical protein [Vibrio ouci]|uniref:Uncharacterized protein n=1 Tax=Vibrio ouci TaxID=2499078 RepID=A0A4Y8WK56_9VIBR|nr:hypothetical protein [Vibrio ouci]TFH93056.1 hypothetical protein ELS82_03650 [Vibrio ouci]
MKKFIYLVIVIFSPLVHAVEWTEPKLVERIHITSNGTYYFKVASGWGAPSCKEAPYIFIRKNEAAAADAILSLILASQSTGKAIKARGTCADKAHFQFDYVIQMNPE